MQAKSFPISDARRVLEESKEVAIEFLRTELATGHTMMDVAEVTQMVETRARTLRNANLVYELVPKWMMRLDLTPGEQEELYARLDDLKGRLDSQKKRSNVEAPLSPRF